VVSRAVLSVTGPDDLVRSVRVGRRAPACRIHPVARAGRQIGLDKGSNTTPSTHIPAARGHSSTRTHPKRSPSCVLRRVSTSPSARLVRVSPSTA
jgi:hypothetical protein